MERKGDFTTQELVKEAGVALQTFYRYFESKDQLLVAVLEDLIGSQTRAREAQAAEISDPVARLRFYVTWPLHTLGQSDAVGAARGRSRPTTGGCSSSSPTTWRRSTVRSSSSSNER